MFNPAFEKGPSFDRARSQIATPFQYIDIALDVATSNQIVNVSGDFLYVDAASTGAVTLELNNQYNDPSAPFYAQPGFGLAALFKQLKLSWTAQPGKIVRLMYSTGDRVVPTNSTTINGVVNTVDGGYSRTIANQAFLGTGSVGPTAAVYSLLQLLNPVASGKSLVLKSFNVSSPVAQVVGFGRRAAAYANLGAAPFNKNVGSPAGVATLRYETNAAILIDAYAGVANLAAGSSFALMFSEPVVLAPGNGFVVVAQAVNTNLAANFEWYEV